MKILIRSARDIRIMLNRLSTAKSRYALKKLSFEEKCRASRVLDNLLKDNWISEDSLLGYLDLRIHQLESCELRGLSSQLDAKSRIAELRLLLKELGG